MDSSQILERLKEQGKITDDDIKSAELASDDELRGVAVAMHSMVCYAEKHTSLEECTLGIQGCDFYAEEKFEEPWSSPCHQKWFRLAELFQQYFPDYKDNPVHLTAACSALNFIQNKGIKGFVIEALEIIGGESQWQDESTT